MQEGQEEDQQIGCLAKADDEELFAFMCTSDYIALLMLLDSQKTKLWACIW